MTLLKKDIAIVSLLVLILFLLSFYKITIMRGKAHIAITQKNMQTMADAIAVYRGDNQGACPTVLSELVPNYLFAIPHHHSAGGVKNNTVKTGSYSDMDGSGGWLVVTEVEDAHYCNVFVNEL